jgi:hypothetical protein
LTTFGGRRSREGRRGGEYHGENGEAQSVMLHGIFSSTPDAAATGARDPARVEDRGPLGNSQIWGTHAPPPFEEDRDGYRTASP